MQFRLWKKPVLTTMPVTAPDDPGPFYAATQLELSEQIESQVVDLPNLKQPPQ